MLDSKDVTLDLVRTVDRTVVYVLYVSKGNLMCVTLLADGDSHLLTGLGRVCHGLNPCL
jgi:hypothetical protein